MRQRHGYARWALAALPLLALAGGLTTLAHEPVLRGPSLDLSLKRCANYPYTVICERNYSPGGPIGCFDTLCDAFAAGAYKCKRTQSACEPH